METNKFVYSLNSSEEEIKLTDEVLNGKAIYSENIKEITKRVLKLSFVEQLHVLNRILDSYCLGANNQKNKNIEKFLEQKCFKSHRDIFINIFNDDINKLEKKYNIKIEII